MRKLFDKVYSSLNREQRRAVFNVNGPLLVLAGAGSGKTTVLVKRIAFIIKYGDAYMNESVPSSVSEEQVARLEAATELSVDEIEGILPEFICAPCAPWQMLAITFTNKAANEIKSRIFSLSLAILHVLSKYLWLGATMLDNVALEIHP